MEAVAPDQRLEWLWEGLELTGYWYRWFSSMTLNHTARIPADNGEEITFRWHLPRGTLRHRMSAMELAEFLVPHMPSVLPLFSNHPRVYAEWQVMLLMLVTQPKEVIDRLVPWMKSVTRTADSDIVEMNLHAVAPQAAGKVYFL